VDDGANGGCGIAAWVAAIRNAKPRRGHGELRRGSDARRKD
jgi:hypothetical protein